MPSFSDPYDEDGLTAAKTVIESKHGDTLAIGYDCYQRLGELLSEAEWEQSSSQQAVHALAARIFDLVANVLRALRHGGVSSAKILTRSLLEASYKLCAIQRDASNFEQYLADDGAALLLALKGIRRYEQSKGGASIAPGLEKKICDLSVQKQKKIEPYVWAERAGMSHFHHLFYSWLSDEIHTSATALNDYFMEHPEFAITVGPDDAGLPVILMIATRGVAVSIQALGGSGDQSLVDWLASVDARLNEVEAR
jgi:Family of unknown function (DUF5677)